jgi:hypothetical protein
MVTIVTDFIFIVTECQQEYWANQDPSFFLDHGEYWAISIFSAVLQNRFPLFHVVNGINPSAHWSRCMYFEQIDGFCGREAVGCCFHRTTIKIIY